MQARHICPRFLSVLLILAFLFTPFQSAGGAAAAQAAAIPAACEPNPLVSNNNDSGDGSLRWAVENACPSSTITFASSFDITLQSGLNIDKPLTIEGGANLIQIFGGATAFNASNIRPFTLDPGITATLSHVQIYNGYAADDGSGAEGVGVGANIWNNYGTLTLNDVVLGSGAADKFGGAIYNTGSLTLNRCSLNAHQAAWSGGAIYNSGDITVIDSQFDGNSAGRDGGALFNNTPMLVRGSQFTGNSAAADGGALKNAADSASFISDSYFESNTANGNGGAVDNIGALHVAGSVLVSNTADQNMDGDGQGGALHSSGFLDLHDSRLRDNQAYSGGALAVSSQAQLARLTIDYNRAGLGGGVYNQGESLAADVSLSQNRLPDLYTPMELKGAGLYNSGHFLLQRGSISANYISADNDDQNVGAGAYNEGLLELYNVTLSANRGRWDALGGALYQANPGPMSSALTRLVHVTVANNTIPGLPNLTGFTSGLDIGGGYIEIANSIIADNGAGDENFAGFTLSSATSQGGNLTNSANQDWLDNTNDLQGVSAGLDPSIQTPPTFIIYPLQSTSPAVGNALPDGCLATGSLDQRGFNRPGDGLGCDSGAYELLDTAAACLANITVQGPLDSGPGSLRQAVADLCPSGRIDFAEPLHIDLGTSIDIAKSLTIDGHSTPGVTVFPLYETLKSSFFIIHPGNRVDLHNLDLRDGGNRFDRIGGAIVNAGDLLLDQVGIYNGYVDFRGGAIYNSGSLTITHSTLQGNRASGHGGAIYTTGALNIGASTIISGNAAGYGGGIYHDGFAATQMISAPAGGYEVVIANSALQANQATQAGGGLFLNAGAASLDHTSFLTNSAYAGGGLYSSSSLADVTDSQFTGNRATHQAGGVYSYGRLNLLRTSLSYNLATGDIKAGSPGYGGAIFTTLSAGQVRPANARLPEAEFGLTIQDSQLDHNQAGQVSGEVVNPGFGGGLLNYVDNPASITNTRFISNTGTFEGGAILNLGPLSVTGSTFQDNTTTGLGGAISTLENLHLTASTLSGNAAQNSQTGIGAGGGIFNGVPLIYDYPPYVAPSRPDGSPAAPPAAAPQPLQRLDVASILSAAPAERRQPPVPTNGVYAPTLIEDTTLFDNTASWGGGGLYNGDYRYPTGLWASAILTRTALLNNQAMLGAGLMNLLGYVDLYDSQVNQNKASAFGAGLANGVDAGLTATRVEVISNTLACQTNEGDIPCTGAGIYNEATLQLANVTLAGNHLASQSAPALLQEYGGAALFNKPSQSGAPASLTMIHTTVTGNLADYPARGTSGLYSAAPITVSNSLLAGNGPDGLDNYQLGTEAPVSLGGNLTNSHDGLFTAANDREGVDPALGGLWQYAPQHWIVPLRLASPAIDNALDAACTAAPSAGLDQRHLSRPVGAACDSGAYEAQGYRLSLLGGDNQATSIGTAFADPLAVQVSANTPGEPLDGLQVRFTPPASGASALLDGSAATVTLSLDASHQAAVAATANSLTGSYTVGAGLLDAQGNSLGQSVTFHLTNQPQPLSQTDLAVSLAHRWDPALVGASNYLTLTVANQTQAPAPGVVATVTLPAGVSLLNSADPACTLHGARLVCDLGNLAAGASHASSWQVFLTGTIPDKTTLELPAVVSSSLVDSHPGDNTTRDTFLAVIELLAYHLEDTPGSEWGSSAHMTTPACGAPFLGEFSNETVSLTLPGLQEHNYARTSFHLYILRSWDGNQVVNNLPPILRANRPEGPVGPDLWRYAMDGRQMLDTTFTNWSYYQYRQAYPGPVGASFPAQTGAMAVNSLCYSFKGYDMDATYAAGNQIAHTGQTLKLDFTAQGLQSIDDESWGLGAVDVYIRALPYRQVFLPVVVARP